MLSYKIREQLEAIEDGETLPQDVVVDLLKDWLSEAEDLEEKTDPAWICEDCEEELREPNEKLCADCLDLNSEDPAGIEYAHPNDGDSDE